MSRRKRPDPFETDTDSDGGLSSSQTSSIHKRRRANDGSSILSTPAPEDEPQSPATTPQSDDDDVDDSDEEIESQTQAPAQLIAAEDNVAVEAGILESVHAVNFMCHENEKWDLGPLINFICGKNGSGKSAILTAIQLCFGGKAAATGRGRKLEDYIRTGQTGASVTCSIKNQGSNAFKHDDYGDSIKIERHWHITASGNCTAGFRIRNANDKVMASKKGDLDEIVEFFTLQFDNPLATLTQDDARSWIADAKPTEKYRLFLRGVLLEQLDADYKLIEENCDNISPKLRQNKEDLDEKKRRKDTAAQKLKESEAHATARQRLHELKHQCIWVQVVEFEAARDALKAEIEKYGESLTAEQAVQEAHTLETERLRQIFDDKRGEADTAEGRVREAQSTQRDLEATVKEKQAAATERKQELQHAKQAVKDAQKDIETKTREIKTEEDRLAEVDGGGAAQRRQDLDDLKDAAKEAGAALETHRNRRLQLDTDAREAKEQLDEAKQKRNAQFDEVKSCKSELDKVRNAGSLPDTRFHPKMPQVIRAIAQETRFRQKPIGPIGKHVTLLKPKFTNMIEKIFGQTLNGFIVTNKADQELLTSLARKCGMPELRVNIVTHGAINLSGKEPAEEFLTVLRALRVEDELITKLMIIAHHVESAILVEDYGQAQKIMNEPDPRNRPANVETCYALATGSRQKGFRLFYRGGNPAQDPVDQYNGPLRMNANVEDQFRLQETRVQEAQDLLDQYEDELRTCQSKLDEARNALSRHSKDQVRLKTAKQTADQLREEKQSECDQDNIAGGVLDTLKAALEECKSSLDTQGTLYQDCVTGNDSAKNELRIAQQEAADAKHQTAILQASVDALRKEAQNADQARMAAIAAANVCQNKITGLQNDKRLFEGNLATQEEDLTSLVEQAEAQGSARVPIPEGETSVSLDQKFERLHAQLTRAERNLGGSHIQLATAATEALDEYKRSSDHYMGLKNLYETLKGSLKTRKERWELFRKYIGRSARSGFIVQLSQRGFRGKLTIDHTQHKLDVKIEPDLTLKDAAGRAVKTLSGGEKTYTQICLLLALWEAMGSPIRCLDEFDVYMDALNRGKTIAMIQEIARQSQGKQYIMISPGSRADITRAPDVKAFEVAPPERGQQRLGFQRVSAAA
ncbi:Structural maintenance of chromosomes protein 6 [Cyphellophora attinorum]|uniref:Structural maintenance of chromosomes protein 6 n=1 Tax=Cyphellophora attinorum TaxID=1664694 RepID=A0A0N1HMG7_9EURO|nr:Structural maintenance of chromosomes protein 6 [Phialophora attinorum]KPI35945.1 Structural maintenance of chromosomes protein 6 [Phialophora attinorum]